VTAVEILTISRVSSTEIVKRIDAQLCDTNRVRCRLARAASGGASRHRSCNVTTHDDAMVRGLVMRDSSSGARTVS